MRGTRWIRRKYAAGLWAVMVSACVSGHSDPISHPPVETTRAEADRQTIDVELARVGGSEESSLLALSVIDDLVNDALEPAAKETPLDPSVVRPPWLGTVEISEQLAASREPLPTPFELTNRQFPTVWELGGSLPPGFSGTSSAVPAEIVARSSWRPDCPVTVEELAYLTLTHWGFDGRRHRGELLVHRDAAIPMLSVFRELYEMGYPIEELRVKGPEDMHALVTGDSNVTSAFECRRSTGSSRWSQHAYGLAIDINPFHNPYLKGRAIIPQLSLFYTDRELALPGMILANDRAVRAFEKIGWSWGGNWTSLKDWMHFSANGN